MANRNRRVMQCDAVRCARDEVRIDVEHRSSETEHTTSIKCESLGDCGVALASLVDRRAKIVARGGEERSPNAEARAGGAVAPERRLGDLRSAHGTRGLALEPRRDALAAEDVLRSSSAKVTPPDKHILYNTRVYKITLISIILLHLLLIFIINKRLAQWFYCID